MLRQPLIEEGVIGVQQFQQAVVLAQYILEEQRRFRTEGLLQGLVEFRKHVGIRFGQFQIAQIQPLPREIIHQGLRPRIVQHAPHLLFEHHRIA